VWRFHKQTNKQTLSQCRQSSFGPPPEFESFPPPLCKLWLYSLSTPHFKRAAHLPHPSTKTARLWGVHWCICQSPYFSFLDTLGFVHCPLFLVSGDSGICALPLISRSLMSDLCIAPYFSFLETLGFVHWPMHATVRCTAQVGVSLVALLDSLFKRNLFYFTTHRPPHIDHLVCRATLLYNQSVSVSATPVVL